MKDIKVSTIYSGIKKTQNNEDDLLSLLPNKLATKRVNIGSYELVVIKTNRTLILLILNMFFINW